MSDSQEQIKVLSNMKTFLRDSSSNTELFNILADELLSVITATGSLKLTIE